MNIKWQSFMVITSTLTISFCGFSFTSCYNSLFFFIIILAISSFSSVSMVCRMINFIYSMIYLMFKASCRRLNSIRGNF